MRTTLPLKHILTAAGILILMLAFRIVAFAQGVAQSPADNALQTVSLVAQIIGWFVLVGTAVYYVFKKNDAEQVKQSRDAWKDLAESRLSKLNDVRLENSEMKGQIKELQDYAEDLRKKNLRLQGDQQ